MRVWLILTGLALLTASTILSRLGGVESVRTEEVVLDDAAGLRLRARLYLPTAARPSPGVLLCHGVTNSKENVEPISLALAERGFVALALDFGGHGESAPRPPSDKANLSDVNRALAYLRGRPEVDSSRLGGLGFSMGSKPVIEAAQEHNEVRAVVALGRPIVAPGECPPRLLMAASVYDQFASPFALESALRRSGGGPTREVVLSDHCDHPLEAWDPVLLTAVVNWLEKALDCQPVEPAAPRTWMLPVARAAALLGSVLLLLLGLHWGLGRLPAERLRSPLFRRGVAIALALACLPAVLLSAGGLLASDVGVAGVLVLLGLNWFLCRHAEPELAGPHAPSWEGTPGTALTPVLGMIATVAGAAVTAAVLYRIVYLLHHPGTVLGLPRFVGEVIAFYPDILLHRFRMLLFSEYSLRVTPSLAWYAILVLEIALPGAALTVASATAERVWRRLQRRRGEPRPRKRARSWKVILVRVGLAVTLLGWVGASILPARDVDTRPIRGLALEFSGYCVVFTVVLLALIRLTRLPCGTGHSLTSKRPFEITCLSPSPASLPTP